MLYDRILILSQKYLIVRLLLSQTMSFQSHFKVVELGLQLFFQQSPSTPFSFSSCYPIRFSATYTLPLCQCNQVHIIGTQQ